MMPSIKHALTCLGFYILIVLDNKPTVSGQTACVSPSDFNVSFSKQPSDVVTKPNSSVSFTCEASLSECGYNANPKLEWHTPSVGYELNAGSTYTSDRGTITILEISRSSPEIFVLMSNITINATEHNDNLKLRCGLTILEQRLSFSINKEWTRNATLSVRRLEPTSTTTVTTGETPANSPTTSPNEVKIQTTANPPLTSPNEVKIQTTANPPLTSPSVILTQSAFSGQQRTAVVYPLLFGMLIYALWMCQNY